ncbi:hypothetical protein PABG_03313 [Paracoccidioides brasiliensis Pb03]|nr:hypothetical protein PABG_03313 [Paracoccidioides brasiliensis Pb03]
MVQVGSISESSHLASIGKTTASAPLFSTRRNPLANKTLEGMAETHPEISCPGSQSTRIMEKSQECHIDDRAYKVGDHRQCLASNGSFQERLWKAKESGYEKRVWRGNI